MYSFQDMGFAKQCYSCYIEGHYCDKKCDDKCMKAQIPVFLVIPHYCRGDDNKYYYCYNCLLPKLLEMHDLLLLPQCMRRMAQLYQKNAGNNLFLHLMNQDENQKKFLLNMQNRWKKFVFDSENIIGNLCRKKIKTYYYFINRDKPKPITKISTSSSDIPILDPRLIEYLDNADHIRDDRLSEILRDVYDSDIDYRVVNKLVKRIVSRIRLYDSDLEHDEQGIMDDVVERAFLRATIPCCPNCDQKTNRYNNERQCKFCNKDGCSKCFSRCDYTDHISCCQGDCPPVFTVKHVESRNVESNYCGNCIIFGILIPFVGNGWMVPAKSYREIAPYYYKETGRNIYLDLMYHNLGDFAVLSI